MLVASSRMLSPAGYRHTQSGAFCGRAEHGTRRVQQTVQANRDWSFEIRRMEKAAVGRAALADGVAVANGTATSATLLMVLAPDGFVA